MGYATQQDMVDRFGETELVQLTNRDNPAATTINATVIGKALADADAQIDGYLGRYTLPLAIVPPMLTRHACDIARYHLYDERATEQAQKRYDDAIAYLKDVAKGDILLGPTTAGETPAPADGAQVESADSVFRRDRSTGFI